MTKAPPFPVWTSEMGKLTLRAVVRSPIWGKAEMLLMAVSPSHHSASSGDAAKTEGTGVPSHSYKWELKGL